MSYHKVYFDNSYPKIILVCSFYIIKKQMYKYQAVTADDLCQYMTIHYPMKMNINFYGTLNQYCQKRLNVNLQGDFCKNVIYLFWFFFFFCSENTGTSDFPTRFKSSGNGKSSISTLNYAVLTVKFKFYLHSMHFEKNITRNEMFRYVKSVRLYLTKLLQR